MEDRLKHINALFKMFDVVATAQPRTMCYLFGHTHPFQISYTTITRTMRGSIPSTSTVIMAHTFETMDELEVKAFEMLAGAQAHA